MLRLKCPLVFVFLLSAVFTASAQSSVPAPLFSHPHGLYERAFTLTLSCEDPSAILFFTTDGSTPSGTSRRYTTPLALHSTTVLRAMAKVGDNCSPIVTSSYIFLESVLGQTNNPEGFPDTWGSYITISGTAKANYEMDPDLTGNADIAAKTSEGLRQLPIVSLVSERDNFFSKDQDPEHGGIYIYTGSPVGDGIGRGWERPVSFELFGGPQNYDLQSDCGVKIHGGHGRLPEKNPKHSFRLVWKNAYGDGSLHYPIYGEQGRTNFNALILRTAFDNSWQHWDHNQRKAAQYSRDLWTRTTQKRMGHPAPDGFWAHLFINGLYWGMYNITERIDKDFCANYFGGNEEDWDVIKVEEMEKDNAIQAANGNLDKWKEMLSVAADAATSNNAYFRLQGMNAHGVRDSTLEPLLDVDNYIDYMIINQYAANTDWDDHNWLAIRRRVNPDAGFRFICWDSEEIFGSLSENVLKPRSRKGKLTTLFASLITNPMFLHRFQERVCTHCTADGILTPDNVVAIWNKLYSHIDCALYAESARWGDYRRDVHPWKTKGELYTVDNQFAVERRRLLEEYFPARTATYLSQLKKAGWYPSLEAPTMLIDGMDAIRWMAQHGDTLDADRTLTLEAPLGATVWYTIDGSAPASWERSKNGTATASASMYVSQNLLTELPSMSDAQRISVRAIARTAAEWSPARTFTFVLRGKSIPKGIHTSTPIASHTTLYDLQNRPVSNSHLLSPGIYISEGKKIVVW